MRCCKWEPTEASGQGEETQTHTHTHVYLALCLAWLTCTCTWRILNCNFNNETRNTFKSTGCKPMPLALEGDTRKSSDNLQMQLQLQLQKQQQQQRMQQECSLNWSTLHAPNGQMRPQIAKCCLGRNAIGDQVRYSRGCGNNWERGWRGCWWGLF